MVRGRNGNVGEPLEQVQAPRNDESFRRQNPPTFNGLGEPADAEKWVRAMDKIFNYLKCTEADKLAYGLHQLVDEADFWWESVKRTLTPAQWERYTWEDFKDELLEKYIPGCYRQRRQNEFWNLQQGKRTVAEYDRLFNQLSRYAPQLVETDLDRADKFRRGLRHEIGISLASHGPLTYAQTLSRAMDIESMLPKERDRSNEQSVGFNPAFGKRKFEGGSSGNNSELLHGPNHRGQVHRTGTLLFADIARETM